MSVIAPNYIDVSSDNALVQKLAKSINAKSKVVDVKQDSNLMPIGFCYWNVENKVKNFGGELVLGWLFLLWKGVCIEAIHHAIWKTPEGNLIDITQHPFNKATKSIFLEDDSIKVDLDKISCIPNKWIEFKSNNNFDSFKSIYLQKLSITKLICDIAYECGYRCSDQRNFAAGKQPQGFNYPEQNIPKLQQLTNQVSALSVELGTVIKKLNKS